MHSPIKTSKITLKQQSATIEDCIENKLSLGDELAKLGADYDDLRYYDYKQPKESLEESSTLAPVTFESLQDFSGNIPAVSFFAGAGGLDIGFEKAGFNVSVSVEIEKLFCDTLRHNYPEKVVIGPPAYSGDVSDHDAIARLLEEVGHIHAPFDGVFLGGPPCQPFSIAANQRFNKSGDNFKRKGFEDEEKGNLLFDYLWFIDRFQPAGFLIENVGGLIELDGDGKVGKALARLEEKGYQISRPRVVNATDYGVPQNRNRCIILGSRMGKLPELPAPNELPTRCKEVFDRSLEGCLNHVTRSHSAGSVERYAVLGYGARDQRGRVDRLNPLLPSKTVIAGGTKGGGRSHLHPYFPRTLSVRECARLQTFPDSYEFLGPVARQFTQVGNAVPPMLAYKLALALKNSL